jgi:hypothetical protein
MGRCTPVPSSSSWRLRQQHSSNSFRSLREHACGSVNLLSALPYASNPRKNCHREDAGLDFAEQTLGVEFDTLSQVLPNPLNCKASKVQPHKVAASRDVVHV